MAGSFPQQQDGLRYLTEGGQETEIMYEFGFELPEFAMFPLLDDPRAVAELRAMYERYLETACAHGFGALMGGFDYRASPDWATRLGYSPAALEEMQLRAIDFLREVGRPYDDQLPALMFVGIVGPRGDAYSLDQRMTAEEAEDYHSTQIATLARADRVGPHRSRPGARAPRARYTGRPGGPSSREVFGEADEEAARYTEVSHPATALSEG